MHNALNWPSWLAARANSPSAVAKTPEEGLPLAAMLPTGWGTIAALRWFEITELIIARAQSRIATSILILQPGPAALTDGLAELEKIIRRWAGLLA